MEELIAHLSDVVERLADVSAVLVVAFGTIEAFVRVVRVAVTPRVTHGERKAIWRSYGMWLLLALEFGAHLFGLGFFTGPFNALAVHLFLVLQRPLFALFFVLVLELLPLRLLLVQQHLVRLQLGREFRHGLSVLLVVLLQAHPVPVQCLLELLDLVLPRLCGRLVFAV